MRHWLATVTYLLSGCPCRRTRAAVHLTLPYACVNHLVLMECGSPTFETFSIPSTVKSLRLRISAAHTSKLCSPVSGA